MTCIEACNSEEVLHVGDNPTVIRFTVVESNTCEPSNLSTSIEQNLLFKKPDRTIAAIPATFTTDGTDGQIEITTDELTLDQVGDWEIRAVIDGYQSSTCKVTVYSKWE